MELVGVEETPQTRWLCWPLHVGFIRTAGWETCSGGRTGLGRLGSERELVGTAWCLGVGGFLGYKEGIGLRYWSVVSLEQS